VLRAAGTNLRGDLLQTELPVAITLMLALPKGNGFDEVVRYCTELGSSLHCPSSEIALCSIQPPKNCSAGNALLKKQLSNQSDHLCLLS